MSLPIIVIGGGGHGRVVIEALLAAGAIFAGVIDNDESVAARLPQSVRRLGGDEVLARHAPAQYLLANGVGGIGEARRRQAFDRCKSVGWRFATIRHPAAVVAGGVVLSEGCQVMAGAVLQPGVRIGANAIVNTRAAIDHDCSIGEHSHIAPGAVLCGDVAVGAETHIGAGAVVIQGCRIGRLALIGAGALILADVPDGTLVYSEQPRRERPRPAT